MAVHALPSTPGPQNVEWRVIDQGGTVQGPLGGTAQRINRPGNRFAVQVSMPAMRPADARRWFSALTRALRLGASWSIRQVTTPTGSPGTVLVDGGSQAGTTLDCDGFNVGYPVRDGQWLSVLTGARRYLYLSAANVIADGTGAATLDFEPPLRAQPADNDPVELGAPVIEGLLRFPPGFVLSVSRLAEPFTFSIEEVA